MKIALDATPLLFPFTGVGRVTNTLCQTMLGLDVDYQLSFYSRKFSLKGPGHLLPKGSLKHFSMPKCAEPFMQKTGMIEKRIKADIYHATDHYMPLKNPQNAVVTVHDTIFLADGAKDWTGSKISGTAGNVQDKLTG